MANGLTRVVVREQNPQVRATNFDEVKIRKIRRNEVEYERFKQSSS